MFPRSALFHNERQKQVKRRAKRRVKYRDVIRGRVAAAARGIATDVFELAADIQSTPTHRQGTHTGSKVCIAAHAITQR